MDWPSLSSPVQFARHASWHLLFSTASSDN
jgi:hypothetical protein